MEKLEFVDCGKFMDEKTARALLERVWWPVGPRCPHCVVIGGGGLQGEPEEGSRSPEKGKGCGSAGIAESNLQSQLGRAFMGRNSLESVTVGDLSQGRFGNG